MGHWLGHLYQTVFTEESYQWRRYSTRHQQSKAWFSWVTFLMGGASWETSYSIRDQGKIHVFLGPLSVLHLNTHKNLTPNSYPINSAFTRKLQEWGKTTKGEGGQASRSKASRTLTGAPIAFHWSPFSHSQRLRNFPSIAKSYSVTELWIHLHSILAHYSILSNVLG